MENSDTYDEFVRLLQAVSSAQGIANGFAAKKPLQFGVPIESQSFTLLQAAYESLTVAEEALREFRKRNPGF